MLKLPPSIRRLHLVLYIVKLTAATKDLIPEQCTALLLNFIDVDEEKKWEVESVLDSCWYHKQYQYLIKLKEFRLEANS